MTAAWTNREIRRGSSCVRQCTRTLDFGIPQQRVAIFLKEVLGLDLRRSAVNKLKESAAAFYEDTYENLIKKIASGRLVHADETKVNLKAGIGYVWAFTNLEDVAVRLCRF